MSLGVPTTTVHEASHNSTPGKTMAKGLADLVAGLGKKIGAGKTDPHGDGKNQKISFQDLLKKVAVGQKAEKPEPPAVTGEKVTLAKKGKEKETQAPAALPEKKKIAKQEKHEEKETHADVVVPVVLAKTAVEQPKPKAEEAGAEKLKAVKPSSAKDDEGGRTGLTQAVNIAGAEVKDLRTGGRKTEKTEDKKFQVVDRRTEAKHKQKAENDSALTTPVSAPVELQTSAKNGESKPGDQVQVLFQAVGGKVSKDNDMGGKNSPIAPQDAAAFKTYMLEKGHAQLVEQARIILKDHNQGEIKLTLYPATLGKVKVALNLNDSHLAGQIFVENQTVKEIFQQNMDQLLRSFQEGGFQNLNIQVSVGNGHNPHQGQKSDQESFRIGDYARQVAVKAEASEASDHKITGSRGERLVNLTA